ncbi:MAG: PilZ domain-containing protein [Candidatus Omnitrophica bacterium]|nr:PilZ domain-containing protein [Candidatus Omnitrophota bacterium]
MDTQVQRRKYERVEKDAVVRYQNLDGADMGISQTLNIGQGGMCFLSSKFMPMARRLVFEIYMPKSLKIIKVVSRVAWVKKFEERKCFTVGVQFLSISRADKQLLLPG